MKVMLTQHKKEVESKQTDYEKKLNRNFGNMTKKVQEEANKQTGAVLDIVNGLASEIQQQGNEIEEGEGLKLRGK